MPLIDAWTAGLEINFEKKKSITYINGVRDTFIKMCRDENENFKYIKNLYKLNQKDREIIEKALYEIENEFSIKFEEEI